MKSVNVLYWPVGKVKGDEPDELEMTIDDICKNLLMDWMPGTGTLNASAFLGWPHRLVNEYTYKKKTWLTLNEACAGIERQWKGFMSWMLGVAGARRVLAEEGYCWIAPLSAFYAEARQRVAFQTQSAPFLPGVVEAVAAPKSKSSITSKSDVRERPDFLAAKLSSSKKGYNLAAAESKGTSSAIASMHKVDDDWKKQANNVRLRHVSDHKKVHIPRHMVIATRVNTRGRKDMTRALELRAWNSDEPDEPTAPSEVIVDIVAAHLYSLASNLDLYQTARAIARTVDDRSDVTESESDRPRRTRVEREEMARIAVQEIAQRGDRDGRTHYFRLPVTVDEAASVQIDRPLIELMEAFSRESEPDTLMPRIRATEEQLDAIERNRGERVRGEREAPTGVRVNLVRRD